MDEQKMTYFIESFRSLRADLEAFASQNYEVLTRIGFSHLSATSHVKKEIPRLYTSSDTGAMC